MRCPIVVSSAGPIANHRAVPSAAPSSAPVVPSTVPFATSTSRMCRWPAPIALSMPSDRIRRWAITVNPATASSPTNSSPIVPSSSTVTLPESAPSALRASTVAPSGSDCRPAPARASTVTVSALPRCPGATSANRSRRVSGFSTSPTTVRPFHPLPSARRNPAVTATSPAPCGHRPSSSRSIGDPYGPAGSCDRRSIGLAEPGTGTR